MTRKDYILLARALKLAREDEMRSGQMWRESGVRTAAQFIANELEDENPRFDRHHFLAVVLGEKALTARPPRKRTPGSEYNCDKCNRQITSTEYNQGQGLCIPCVRAAN